MRERDDDRRWMEKALALAALGGSAVQPNPMVGAVLVKEGRLIGEGWHRGPGLPHAEREALAAADESPAGATLYVSLEPCHLTGRTPPCTEAILEAGIARVVYAMADPNPAEAGRSHRLLEAAGLAVDGGLFAEPAAALNEIYCFNQERGRPLVVLKGGASLNGMLAPAGGEPILVTGEAARREGQRLRAVLGAVGVGGETALRDRPRLDLRLLGETGAAPRPVVFDGSPPRCPADLGWEGRRPLLLLPADAEAEGAAHAERGFTVLPVPRGPDGRLDLAHALAALWQEGVAGMLVEGGGRLLSAFLAAGLWERWELFVAPRLLPADGRPFWAPAAPLEGLRFAAARERGDDVQLTLRPAPAEAGAR